MGWRVGRATIRNGEIVVWMAGLLLEAKFYCFHIISALVSIRNLKRRQY